MTSPLDFAMVDSRKRDPFGSDSLFAHSQMQIFVKLSHFVRRNSGRKCLDEFELKGLDSLFSSRYFNQH